MIWYAFEIVMFFVLAAAGVGLYIFLVHSDAFARFLNRLTLPDDEAVEEQLGNARLNVAEVLEETRREIKEKAARAARLKKL